METREFGTTGEAFAFASQQSKAGHYASIKYGSTRFVTVETKEEYEARTKPSPKAVRNETWSSGIYKPTIEYLSPISGKEITDRGQRREDLKRSGCREVDPSEFRAEYKNERFIKKHGIRN